MSIPVNLDRMAFSRRESNYAISRSFNSAIGPVGQVLLRHIYGGEHRSIFQLEAVQDGNSVDAHAEARADIFTLSHDGGTIELIMPDPNVIRVRTRGLGLRLTGHGPAWSLLIPAGGNRWRAIIGRAKLLFMPLVGDLDVTSHWQPMSGTHHRHHGCRPMIVDMPADSELLMVGYESEVLPPPGRESFDEARERVAVDFAGWRDACPPAPDRFADARDEAAYINWSSVVPANGNHRAPAMLMSKNWMVNTWNWDNCFNAWASTHRDVDFAWDQYLLYFQHQHETGALGDEINQQSIGWSYTKPPVHGWILRRMMDISSLINEARLGHVYEPLSHWTEWWFTYRDDDGDGICQYHHGNDSGWDDATAFDIGSPTETPDLNALLIVQMDVIGDIAMRLGRKDEADLWKQRSERMLETFIEHNWRDGKFVALESGTHRYGGDGDSLLNFMPLVLGHRLPTEQLNAMIEGLTRPGRFLTEWGLATEALNSSQFLQTGYWRGALWPPPMMFVIDGLADAGRTDLAADLAERFCRTCATHGFGENHDALTGKIHYDPAYTWSSSIWQILTARYLR